MSSTINLTGRPALPCKPAFPTNLNSRLYTVQEGLPAAEISFRSLELDTDIVFLYDWVNRSYTRRFWQWEGTIEELRKLYESIIGNPSAHSFIGLYNGKPVCLVDLYLVQVDQLSKHVDWSPCDCGLHLLMLPPDQMTRGISLLMLRHFIRFYFSYEHAGDLYAEPDIENVHANRLAVKAGFSLVKPVQLSYKKANLYCITREQFQSLNHG